MNCSANSASILHIWCLALLIFGFCFCRVFSNEVLCISSEREALLKFKHHLRDPTDRLISWAPYTDCCEWDGVICSNVTGHVIELHLRSSAPPLDEWSFDDAPYEAYERSRFGGHINSSLLDLKHLSYLDLSGNNFNGMNVPIFFGSLTSLTYLNLSGAGFIGKIPYQIGNLSNLLYLDLKNNYYYTTHGFSGEVLHQIGNLTKLIHLDLGNTLYGYFDELSVEDLQWLSSLSSLQYIDMTSINLSKASNWLEIINKFLNLKELHLLGCPLQNHNHLSNINFSSLVVLDLSYIIGYPFIPNWVFGLHNLESLMLRDNEFKGPIPKNIQNLTLLKHLDLSSNLFNSSIPNGLYGCHHLKFLNLGFNNFYGTISDAIGNLSSLVTLDMSGNQLEGNLPTSLGNLSSLVKLNMSGNQLEGNLPTSLGNLSSLITLDMIGNQFEGNLPTSLGNLTSLVFLDLLYNQLEGSLPASLGNLCNLKVLAFSINKCNQQILEILDILSSCVSQRLKVLVIDESKLSGHLPDKIGSFKSLVELDLITTNIGGPLPRSLGKLTSLKYLHLEENQFTKNPFEIIGQLSQLEELVIYNNQFYGVVNETHLAGLTSLEILSASNNQFTLEVSAKWSPRFRLTELYMDSWNLGPNFPTWILSQKNLSSLSMSNTSISDSIPTLLWSALSNADFIDISHNHIYGELSNTLMNSLRGVVDLSSNNLSGQLPYISPHLYHLDLSNNSFSGSITNFLCSSQDGQKSLEFLNLASNNLSGQISDCWMTYQNLVTVRLEDNFFFGRIPKSLGSLPSLQNLQLRNNSLSGNFPMFLKNRSELICLDLGENEISGSIPSWVGERLLNLTILRLRSNNFSGQIPHQICTLKFLRLLDLAQNNLSGHIPKCMNQMNGMMIKHNISWAYISCRGRNDTANCQVSVLVWLRGREDEYSNALWLMTSIDLSKNKLSGGIPTEITSLSQLLSLNLSANHLRGRIPETIGNMGSLLSLDFSRNQLSGEIPQSITKLSFLEELDVSHNNLTGKIPTGTQLQTFDASRFIGNDLCGPPLPINCGSPETFPNTDEKGKKGNGIKINWFFVSMAFGFVVGFWGFVGPLFLIRSWRHTYYGWLDRMWCKIRYCWW